MQILYVNFTILYKFSIWLIIYTFILLIYTLYFTLFFRLYILHTQRIYVCKIFKLSDITYILCKYITLSCFCCTTLYSVLYIFFYYRALPTGMPSWRPTSSLNTQIQMISSKRDASPVLWATLKSNYPKNRFLHTVAKDCRIRY